MLRLNISGSVVCLHFPCCLRKHEGKWKKVNGEMTSTYSEHLSAQHIQIPTVLTHCLELIGSIASFSEMGEKVLIKFY